jgi:site-specific DNA-cytosine methylase
MKPLVVDLFSGWRGWGCGFKPEGYRIIGVELGADRDSEGAKRCTYDESHVMSVLDIDEEWCKALIERNGPVRAVVASPPCTGFSVMSCRYHWTPPDAEGNREPKSDTARMGIELVEHTLKVIAWLNPDYFWIENPVGILRKLPLLEHLQHTTVTYCMYGEDRNKPTDLWGLFPRTWEPRPRCTRRSNSKGIETVWIDGLEWVPHEDDDQGHRVARRGDATGTQGIKQGKNTNAARSVIPFQLAWEIAKALKEADEKEMGWL